MRKAEQALPTHFFSIRVADAAVVCALASTQAAIIAQSPWLEPCLVAPEKAHITLLVFNAGPDDSLLPKAIEALQSTALGDLQGSRTWGVQVRNIASFGERVVYAEVDGGQAFAEFVTGASHALHRRLIAHGVPMPPFRPPVPHVTLMKVRRGYGPQRIRMSTWETWASTDFGPAQCGSIDLHPMEVTNPADGYYTTLSSLRLGGTQDEGMEDGLGREEAAGPGAQPPSPSL